MRGAVLAVCTLGLAGAAGAAEKWVEVRSPNFRVVSNAGERAARKVAWEFEQVRAAYARLWPWARLTAGRPVSVVALKDEATLRRWAPQYFEVKGGIGIASVTAHGADGEYLVLRTDTRPDSRHVTPEFTLYRAYLGALLGASFERRLPPWLSNGLAEVFANVSVNDDEVQVGRPVPRHMRNFNGQARLPLRTVLEAPAGSDLLRKDARRDVFDAQCFVLVHYLAFADGGAHAGKLNRFMRLWAAGAPQERALAEAFGDLAALERALPAYASRPVLPFGRLKADVNVEREKLPARPMAPAEWGGVQAAVLVAMHRPKDAQAALQLARAADPEAAGSYDVEGLLADFEGSGERAREAYERAVQKGSTRAHSHYRAAQLAWKPAADAQALGTVRRLLERAVELNGDHANALSFLAETLVRQKDAQAALSLGERAVGLAPGEAYHHVALARVQHALGRADEARAGAQRGLELAESDRERTNAREFLEYLDRAAAHEAEQAAWRAREATGQACHGGDAEACARLLPDLERECGDGQGQPCAYAAFLYATGRGVGKDAGRAASLFERGCAAGEQDACGEHAWMVAHGMGVPKDERKAQAALEALCSAERMLACQRLALLHAGRPGPQERARAKELLAKACAGGEPQACSLAKSLP